MEHIKRILDSVPEGAPPVIFHGDLGRFVLEWSCPRSGALCMLEVDDDGDVDWSISVDGDGETGHFTADSEFPEDVYSFIEAHFC